jgi:hypothetical protein
MSRPSDPNTVRLARARIEPISAERFQFTDTNDTGFVAHVLLVRGWDGKLIELVAWKEGEVNRWWLRTGALALLGEDLAELAGIRKEPIHLVETPLAWFHAVKSGRQDVIAVIDWSADPRLVMTGLNIVCSTAMSKRLRQWHAEHAKMNFTVSVEGARRAA